MTIGPVIDPTVTPGSVVFDSTEFLAMFPQFSTVLVAALTANFNLACQLLDNTAASIVQDAPTRQYYLYLLTAHITQLLNGVNGSPPSGIVGRISSATQGSITVQSEWAAAMGNAEAYFVQTIFGATFWQATATYRTAHYVPPECDIGEFDAFNAWPQ